MGYAGGTKENPTYHSLGDHSETVQIDYDSSKISYAELLDIFWESHDPTAAPWLRQYMSIIFYHNEEQRRLALETRSREEAKLGRKVYAEIVPATVFYLAEDYHQKYYLREARTLMAEFNAIYSNARDFMNSTAAARVNGYTGGYGTPAALQEELSSLGLSPSGQAKLLDIAQLQFRLRN